MAPVHDERTAPVAYRGDRGGPARSPPVGPVRRAAHPAESLGYGAVFLPEIAGRDAFAALSALAETSSLLLGTGIVPMTSRVPRLTAMGAATVDERSGATSDPGHRGCGLGMHGRPRCLGGAGPPDPCPARRCSGAAPRRGSRAALPAIAVRGAGVDLAGLGPRSMRLAGQMADGVLLNWCVRPTCRAGQARHPARPPSTPPAADAARRDGRGLRPGVRRSGKRPRWPRSRPPRPPRPSTRAIPPMPGSSSLMGLDQGRGGSGRPPCGQTGRRAGRPSCADLSGGGGLSRAGPVGTPTGMPGASAVAYPHVPPRVRPPRLYYRHDPGVGTGGWLTDLLRSPCPAGGVH